MQTAAPTPASYNEQWNRLNNDPLLMVRTFHVDL